MLVDILCVLYVWRFIVHVFVAGAGFTDIIILILHLCVCESVSL